MDYVPSSTSSPHAAERRHRGRHPDHCWPYTSNRAGRRPGSASSSSAAAARISALSIRQAYADLLLPRRPLPRLPGPLSEVNRRIDDSSSAASTSSPSAAIPRSSPARAESTGTSTGSRSATGYPSIDAGLGLFVSVGREGEPERFGEPPLPDQARRQRLLRGARLDALGRPHLDDILDGIDYVVRSDYPARGEA